MFTHIEIKEYPEASDDRFWPWPVTLNLRHYSVYDWTRLGQLETFREQSTARVKELILDLTEEWGPGDFNGKLKGSRWGASSGFGGGGGYQTSFYFLNMADTMYVRLKV